MATYYVDNGSSGNQYYFDSRSATTSSQSYRAQPSPVYNASYPTGHLVSTRSPYQSIRVEQQSAFGLDDPYRLPQQHQSVGGFSRTVTQQYHQPAPPPQVRARMRSVGNQESYSSQPVQASPQQHHFQFDSHRQPGHPTGSPVVYQTPGAAQFTHRNVDLWTEDSSRGRDQVVQAQRVAVQPVSTGSPQQSNSVSPSRPQDSLQQYYSQLTPEQHQQLLRQQQTVIQQVSPSSSQYRSTASAASGANKYPSVSPNQQPVRARTDSERQRQDEQDYYAAQRQMGAQRVQPQEPASHPVGIRSLASKFAGPTASTPPYQQRSRSTSSRHYSSSSYASKTTSNAPPRLGNPLANMPIMTYSALPKSREPPVNSAEYYQMQMQQHGGQGYANIQQAAAPAHIQHAAASLGPSYSSYAPPPPQPPPQQQHQQHQQSRPPGSSLTSLRDQYMYRAKESALDDLPAQPVQNISRTIVGEDNVPEQKAPVSKTYQQPAQPDQGQTSNDNTEQPTGAQEDTETTQVEPEASA